MHTFNIYDNTKLSLYNVEIINESNTWILLFGVGLYNIYEIEISYDFKWKYNIIKIY